MQIASQTLREACGVGRYLEHLCGSVRLSLTILCFSISPNNCEEPESSHCIHPKSMAFPHQAPIDLPHLHSIEVTSGTIGVKSLSGGQMENLES